MPGIVVFNRRWVVGSDDFVIPFGIAFVLRVIWYENWFLYSVIVLIINYVL